MCYRLRISPPDFQSSSAEGWHIRPIVRSTGSEWQAVARPGSASGVGRGWPQSWWSVGDKTPFAEFITTVRRGVGEELHALTHSTERQ